MNVRRYVIIELPSGKHFKLQQSFRRDWKTPDRNATAVKAVLGPAAVILYYQPQDWQFKCFSGYWREDVGTYISEDSNWLDPIEKRLEEEIVNYLPRELRGN